MTKNTDIINHVKKKSLKNEEVKPESVRKQRENTRWIIARSFVAKNTTCMYRKFSQVLQWTRFSQRSPPVSVCEKEKRTHRKSGDGKLEPCNFPVSLSSEETAISRKAEASRREAFGNLWRHVPNASLSNVDWNHVKIAMQRRERTRDSAATIQREIKLSSQIFSTKYGFVASCSASVTVFDHENRQSFCPNRSWARIYWMKFDKQKLLPTVPYVQRRLSKFANYGKVRVAHELLTTWMLVTLVARCDRRKMAECVEGCEICNHRTCDVFI